jgi:hypothetical protein
MTRADRLALILSIFAVGAAYFVAFTYFEQVPHLEDEIAYLWQAQAMARGRLTLPSPVEAKSFLVPFVVDYNGQRFGKYPIGWPALLAVAVWLGGKTWINPLLAGLGVWLTYRLGKRVWGEAVGLLAALLTLSSPFFLMNSGVLLAHPFGLVLSAAFALAWLEAFDASSRLPRWLPVSLAGAALGLLALTRPLTALAVGLPFSLHGLVLLARGGWPVRRRLLALGGLALGVAGLNFLWQYAATGNPWLNTYTLWWPYDRIGFGPGIGNTASGHTWSLAMFNTRISLRAGAADLFGWGRYSWIFLPLGGLTVFTKRNWRGLLVGSVFFSLVAAYTLYWVSSWLLGPRYYYEGLFSLTLLSAAGLACAAGWPLVPGAAWPRFSGWRRMRPLGMAALLVLLLAINLSIYTPMRLDGMRNLYTMSRADLAPFLSPSAQAYSPALIIVHTETWMDYGVLIDLESPFLDSPFIFAWSRGPHSDARLAVAYSERRVFHYYPDTPGVFYTAARPRP